MCVEVVRPTHFAERVADVVIVLEPFLHLDGQTVGKLQLTVGVRAGTYLHLMGNIIRKATATLIP